MIVILFAWKIFDFIERGAGGSKNKKKRGRARPSSPCLRPCPCWQSIKLRGTSMFLLFFPSAAGSLMFPKRGFVCYCQFLHRLTISTFNPRLGIQTGFFVLDGSRFYVRKSDADPGPELKPQW